MKKITFFLHMPKAAGTTLKSVIDRQYNKAQIKSISNGFLAPMKKEIMSMSSAERENLQLIRGHMEFGLHEIFPGYSFSYFTILRNPVDRVISHYNYAKREKNHYLHNTIVDKKMSLEDYVTSGITSELSNGQVRLLTAQCDLQNPGNLVYGSNDPAVLQKAINNLEENFSVVGLQEYFEQSLGLLASVYGWNISDFSRLNAAPASNSAKDYSRETIAAIERYNELDMQLFQYALNNLAAKLAEKNISIVTK